MAVVLWSVTRGRNGTGAGPVLTQPATSAQYVQAQVYATLAGAVYSPVNDTVQVAFVPQPATGPPPNPASGQFNAAYWQTDSTGPTAVYWASCMVGPGGVVLAAGAYATAWQVTDSPTVPVLWGPVLLIT